MATIKVFGSGRRLAVRLTSVSHLPSDVVEIFHRSETFILPAKIQTLAHAVDLLGVSRL